MRNYRHIIRSVKYYPRKHQEPVNNTTTNETVPPPKPDLQQKNKENNIVRDVVNKTLDSFEAEYQAFIADLKAKKEREEKAKEEAEQAKIADDFEAEYQAFIEELKMKKEQNETSTEETIVQD